MSLLQSQVASLIRQHGVDTLLATIDDIQKTQPIGTLTAKDNGHVVVCFTCDPQPAKPCPVYPVNVLPYRQTCDKCGRDLVQGNPSWPILFDGR